MKKHWIGLVIAAVLLGASYDPGRFPIQVADLETNTDGMIITWGASGDPTSVGPGTAGQVLTSAGAGAEPAFETLSLLLSELANGTAGQIITWGAGGAPAVVATGTSGQALTSNGAGAAPTFQNVAPTKEFLVPVLTTTAPSTLDDWNFVAVGASSQCKFIFTVPNDFTSLTGAVVVVIPDATETVQWDLDASVAVAGEDYNADARQALDETKSVTVNDLTDLDISASLTGLAAGDYVAVRFQSDTDTLRIIGLRFRYN